MEVEDDHEPSSDAVRMARNLALFRKQNYLAEKGEEIMDEQTFQARLLAPILEQDWTDYQEEARQIEAKLALTKECIAAELEVDLEDIAFIPQTRFHIDMELFVTPTGEIILHDDQRVEGFLNRIRLVENLTKRQAHLLDRYTETAHKCTSVFAKVRESQRRTLGANRMAYHSLPLIFEAPEVHSSLNYCNGIFVESKKSSNEQMLNPEGKERSIAFITTGPAFREEDVVHCHFTAAFEHFFPGVKLKGVAGMSQVIADNDGGVHCLTTDRIPILLPLERRPL